MGKVKDCYRDINRQYAYKTIGFSVQVYQFPMGKVKAEENPEAYAKMINRINFQWER